MTPALPKYSLVHVPFSSQSVTKSSLAISYLNPSDLPPSLLQTHSTPPLTNAALPSPITVCPHSIHHAVAGQTPYKTDHIKPHFSPSHGLVGHASGICPTWPLLLLHSTLPAPSLSSSHLDFCPFHLPTLLYGSSFPSYTPTAVPPLLSHRTNAYLSSNLNWNSITSRRPCPTLRRGPLHLACTPSVQCTCSSPLFSALIVMI